MEGLFQKHTSDVQGNAGVGSPVLGVHSFKCLTGKVKSAQFECRLIPQCIEKKKSLQASRFEW